MSNLGPLKPKSKPLVSNFYMEMLPKEGSNARRLGRIEDFNIHTAKDGQYYDADGNIVGRISSGTLSLGKFDQNGNLQQVLLRDEDGDGNYDNILLEHGYQKNGWIEYRSSEDNGVYDKQDIFSFGKGEVHNESENGF